MRSLAAVLILAIVGVLGSADARVAVPVASVIPITAAVGAVATPDAKPQRPAPMLPRATLNDDDRDAAFGLLLLLTIQGNPVRP